MKGERRDREKDERHDREKGETGGQWEQVKTRKWKGKETGYRTNQIGHEGGSKPQGQIERRDLKEQNQVYSYYFTNFPSYLSLGDLNSVFTRWGRLVDLFIPNKRNQQGKRFGFVRFMNVKAPMELETGSDLVWVFQNKG